ncbi:hypothetical protein [Winogradskyella alexanderae]|uniref:Lipoprotein n=1 Tax=Winogradskyella alexanderae TaxID=2877123 RepID=A0ABS7XSB0_9FLAO|nr:hypothetical protein [Winogradskyella alexanderae]MCA0132917.1 hypothetical protein [Winogradskyella alexanderae]
MKKVVFFLIATIFVTSCNTQDKKSANNRATNKEAVTDSIKRPKESWKVNKEVDEDGNIIRYDSIYSWSSSGPIKGLENDSIFDKMQAMMHKRFSMLQPSISGFAKHDSIMKQFFDDDFFSDDFFSNSLDPNFPSMDDMIKRMEAMRQQFFDDRNRYIIPPETKKKEKPESIKKKQV